MGTPNPQQPAGGLLVFQLRATRLESRLRHAQRPALVKAAAGKHAHDAPQYLLT